MHADRTRSVLFFSFLVIGTAGTGFIVANSVGQTSVETLARCLFFLAIMLTGHVTGFRLYVEQRHSPEMMQQLNPHLPLILLTQIVCLTIAALMLDSGIAFLVCLMACVLHWMLIGLLCGFVERSNVKRLTIRWGFFPCLALTATMAVILG